MYAIGHEQNNIEACRFCNLYSHCLPGKLNQKELTRFQKLVYHKVPLAAGNTIFEQGMNLSNIYIVRAGSCKSFRPTFDGRQLVNGFFLPGSILGLNAVAGNIHSVFTETLQTTALCQIHFHSLLNLCYQIPALHRQYIHLIKNELLKEKYFKSNDGRTVDSRVVGFLLHVSEHSFHTRGSNSKGFYLGMNNSEIAGYLNMAEENVTQVLNRYQHRGLITVNGKHVTIIKHHALFEMAKINIKPSIRKIV